MNGHEDTAEFVKSLLAQGVGISVISEIEVLEGVMFGRDPTSMRQRFDEVMRAMTVLPLDSAIAERAAEIRGRLRRSKRPVNERALDILVAATAIYFDLMLVSRNAKHFDDIDGLQILSRPEPID